MKINAKKWTYGAVAPICLLLFILTGIPIGVIFYRALVYEGTLDVGQTIQTIMNPDNLQTITNTLLLGIAVVICSTVLALPLAFLTVRTKIAEKKWLDIVLLIPFMTPPYIASMGWILFTQRRGLFQQMFPFTGDFSENFFSFWGIVLTMSFHLFPFILTILKNALLNIGASLDESAVIFGGGFFYRLRRVTLPLITGNYAIGALLVFVKAVSEYGTPATIGQRIGFSVFVTAIHHNATIAPINFNAAASLSSLLIFICFCIWFLQNYVTAKKSYKLVGGKGTKRVEKKLSAHQKIAAWGYIIALLVVAIGIPYFSVVMTSLIRLRGQGMVSGNFTLAHYSQLLTENPRAVQAFRNSLFLAFFSATIAAVLGTACASIIYFSQTKFRKVLHVMSLLPDMLPSIVFSIGIMIFWNSIFHIIPLYNHIGIMLLAYVTLFLPFSVQYVTSSYTQIADSLIWAGSVFGGTPFYVFRRIIFPLLLRGIFVGWMMTFIISFRELVTASILSPPNTLVVSTFIMREFEQGSVSVGMAMAVLTVLFTTGTLIIINSFLRREES
ncbi:iron ABC transporter permease [Enterococcus sp. DIV1298c]|uniref:ABC transporter permease n=1 Tax=Enterococcus sp. DIV1298c TaxID=2815328 RepID=UPI001A92A8C7|nr:iron ABC transporter permease [Enterococcus sp. DIV1298c]MBO0461430.1 iron ABC transporter permease [Enterococcus sp. DIV1298c]